LIDVGTITLVDDDCDDNGMVDSDEIAADPSLDCNGNLDECDISFKRSADCDEDMVPDDCQGAAGALAEDAGGQGGSILGNGDTNGDLSMDRSDAIYILAFLFQGGPAPEPCPAAGAGASAQGQGAATLGNGDLNGDNSVDLSDTIYLLNHLFQGGPAPEPCPSGPPPEDNCTNGVDDDEDGAIDCVDSDCVP